MRAFAVLLLVHSLMLGVMNWVLIFNGKPSQFHNAIIEAALALILLELVDLRDRVTK